MAWTAPATAVTGDIIPASFWNTNGRDNLNYLKGLTDGTGGTTIVIVPNQLTVWNDGNFFFAENANGPYINFDSGSDLLQYFRADNTLRAYIANVLAWQVDGNGKMTGAGFYASSEFSLTSGANTTMAHGLGARPRAVWGYHTTATGTENSKTRPITQGAIASQVGVPTVDATNIQVSNNFGSTIFGIVYAMR